jgi:hypothetical protein
MVTKGHHIWPLLCLKYSAQGIFSKIIFIGRGHNYISIHRKYVASSNKFKDTISLEGGIYNGD